jgi:hypothetical protein
MTSHNAADSVQAHAEVVAQANEATLCVALQALTGFVFVGHFELVHGGCL